jgi:hypothetical protein
MRKLGYTGKLFREFVQFAMQNKMYWIIPLVILLGLMVLLILAGQGATPFIYTLF